MSHLHLANTNQSYPHASLSMLPYLLHRFIDLKRLLPQNGYPQGFITSNLNDVLNKNKNRSQMNPLQRSPQNMLLFYYLILVSIAT